MKIAKLNEAAHNHILLGEVLTSVKRIAKAYQIWRIDRRYQALNRDLDWYDDALKEAQANAERCRVTLMIRRQQLHNDMIQLGGH